MAAYVGPLLLVLLGVGGLVVVLARRFRDRDQTSSEELPPRETRESPQEISLPPGAIVRPSRIPVAERGRRLAQMSFRRARSFVRGIFRITSRLGSGMRRDRRTTIPAVPAAESERPPAFPTSSVLRPSFSTLEHEEPPVSGDADEFRALRLGATLADRVSDTGQEHVAPEPVLEPLSEEPVFTEKELELPIVPISEIQLETLESSAPPIVVPTFQDPVKAREEEPEPRRTQTKHVSLEADVHEVSLGRRKVVGRVTSARHGNAPRHRAEVENTALQATRQQKEVREELAEDDITTATRLLEKGEYARVESMLTDLLAANPRDLAAYTLLARLYLARNDFVQTKEVCEEALKRHPESGVLQGLLGRAYIELGQYGKALSMLQRAHDADERNVEYLEQLLRIATSMDRRPLVHVTAEKILALDPQHADAKKSLARVAE